MKKILVHYEVSLDNSELNNIVDTMRQYGTIHNSPDLPDSLKGTYEIEHAADFQAFSEMLNELDAIAFRSRDINISDFEIVEEQ